MNCPSKVDRLRGMLLPTNQKGAVGSNRVLVFALCLVFILGAVVVLRRGEHGRRLSSNPRSGRAVLLLPRAWNKGAGNSRLAFGDTLPEFCLTTISGDTVTSASLKGEPALLVFLPLNDQAVAEAAYRVAELTYPYLDRYTVLLVLVLDRSASMGTSLDSLLRTNPMPTIVASREVIWRTFRIPWFACSYLILADSEGIVRLGTPYVDRDALVALLDRYR